MLDFCQNHINLAYFIYTYTLYFYGKIKCKIKWKNIDYVAAFYIFHSIYKSQEQLGWQVPSTEWVFPVYENLRPHLCLKIPNYNVCHNSLLILC